MFLYSMNDNEGRFKQNIYQYCIKLKLKINYICPKNVETVEFFLQDMQILSDPK